MWIGASRTLKRLALNERDVIADVGAGKGLVVLLAAEYGVRGVIGVEINSELAREAANHVERNRGGLKAQEVEIVCDDALEWEVPEDLSVVYMNNPFTGATFDRFVERLFGSLEAHPRGLRVVYAYPAEHERLMRTGRAQVLDVRPVTLLRRPGWWKSLEITVTYALGEGGLPAQRGARSAAVEYWGKRRG
jgi:SAM-dependent methyltransferase